MPNWGRQQLLVNEVVPPARGAGHPRPVFKLADTHGEQVKGQYYHEEVQRVPEPAQNIFEVERILRRRTDDDGRTETLVKFKGWPDKFNRWLTAEELTKYQRAPIEQQQQ